jgi:membrane protease YdiL (CAAX protease family)
VLALVVIYVGAFAYEQVLSLFGDWSATDEQGLVPQGWDSSRAAPFVAFFLVVTLLAPVVEELTYRGLGITLLQPWGSALAVIVSGLLFGAAHGLVVGLPILAFFGIVLGWLRLRTDSVFPGMMLHATFNGIALIVAVSGA